MHTRFTSASAFLVVAVLVLSLGSGVAHGARARHVDEIETLPENEDEQRLWDIASGHENNIGNEGRLIRDREMEAYLEGIAERLLQGRLAHLDIEIDFIIVQNNLLSAWVYPYGTIAVNTGLLAGMENEAQLAAILAHELSHFMQRHSYRELISENRQSFIGKGLGLLTTAAVAAKTGVVDTGLMKAGGMWTDLVTSGYSRKNEHAADAEGLELMAVANYDRAQAVKAFELLKQNDAYGVVSPALLWSSHPTLDDRIDNLEKAVAREQRRKDHRPGEVPQSAAYYRAIAPALLRTGAQDVNERYFERARLAFQKYRDARPDEAQGHFLIGETYRLEAPDGPDFESRMAAYQAAIAAEPEFAAAHKELGLAHRQQGHTEPARAALEQYLALEPDAVDAGIIRWYLDGL